jgi:hypothetical protein
MNISQPFIERPVATSLLMAAVGFVGLVAFPFLPVAPLPPVIFQYRQTLHGAAQDHGSVGGSAAGASVRTDPRGHAIDLHERDRCHLHHHQFALDHATSIPRPRTSRPQ